MQRRCDQIIRFRDWLSKAMEESTRRVADAYSPWYDPQSPTKELGPWGWGSKPTMTLDEILEELEEKRMEDLERDIFGFDDDDEVGYYNHDDWGVTNTADGAFCPEAFDSCWDRSG
ncbi:hypothetical protein VE00_06925 [Pseudogymnoascus sp. WSF 3629]|nr:hypothetical protein VE00_06925 [Pseudogymnoascus sp. WSF 3629]